MLVIELEEAKLFLDRDKLSRQIIKRNSPLSVSDRINFSMRPIEIAKKSRIALFDKCADKKLEREFFLNKKKPYDALSNGLRAAGDVKFTMYVSVVSTIAGRLYLSYLLGIVLDMGVIGIAIAMVCDWVIRAVLFIWRQKSGKWKAFQVI